MDEKQTLTTEQVKEAFLAVKADRKFHFGWHRNGQPLQWSTLLWVVRLYEKVTGKRLLPDGDAPEGEIDHLPWWRDIYEGRGGAR